MKRKISLFLTLVLMFSTLLSVNVFAATSYPSASASGYIEFKAQQAINVYKDTACKTRGTSSPAKKYNASVASGDVCYIYKITSSYIQVNYPTSSGRRTGYIKRSDLFDKTAPEEYISSAQTSVTVYKADGNSYIEKGDKVWRVDPKKEYSGYRAVIYDAKSGKRAYKMGYVTQSDFEKIKKINIDDGKPSTSPATNQTLPNAVFLQQVGKNTCTLSSSAMMLRARMYLSGKSYSGITENSIKSTAWAGGSGLKWSWTYKSGSKTSISVSRVAKDGIEISELKEILNKHPEGIVLYCARNTSNQHAVLVTDYVGDTFYCADPYGNYSKKRIKLENSLLGSKFGKQSNILDKVDAYWYVSSYSIK